MYRIFKAHATDRLKGRGTGDKNEKVNNDGEEKNMDFPCRQENHERLDRGHNEENDTSCRDVGGEFHEPLRLRRSLSRDSFSTFTTAAETPSQAGSSARSTVIVFGDFRMPSEIYVSGIPQDQQRKRRNYITKSRDLPKSMAYEAVDVAGDEDPIFLDDGEELDLCYAPSTQNDMMVELPSPNDYQRPEEKVFRVHPSKSNYYDSRVMEKMPSRRRSHSNGGDAEYLEAPPPRWTRFEI